MNLPADHYEPHLCRCFGQNHWCLSSTRATTRTTPLTSTTQFEYTDLKLSGRLPEGNLAANLTVRNSGALDGVEVVQLYVSDLAYSIPRTRKELKGFEKVFLKAGQSQTIRLPLNERAFCFYDNYRKKWVREPGNYEILVGASSRDIRLRATLTLE